MHEWKLQTGASVRKGSVCFRIWAPNASAVFVEGEGRKLRLVSGKYGWWEGEDSRFASGDRYSIRLDDGPPRPDPVSRFLPEGVHGPTGIVDPADYRWQDGAWKGIPFRDYILYEFHTGTFTEEGTLEGAVSALPHLKELGVTCVEIMPVSQFPGKRNWGYDGVSLYAVQNSYGGPVALKRFVDACHNEGIAVCLDVVYNHFGPEGNYLSEFGRYFTDAYRTPWGPAVNYDGPGSDGVRQYIIDNTLYWYHEYHVDALRLDAVHSIFDSGVRHILRDLALAARGAGEALGRPCLLIAESDQNDPRLLAAHGEGGHGLDGQWADDFHHAVHVTLTGERNEYYRDYSGPADVMKSLHSGFVYDGCYSEFRRKSFGAPLPREALGRLVFALQNHDQVGNRARGDRLTESLPLEALRAAAVLQFLAPAVPLLFMGEEYGETAPFRYFVDHGDSGLLEAVRKGRAEEFPGFQDGYIPDPASEDTFIASRVNRTLKTVPEHARHFQWYLQLVASRRKIQPARYAAEGRHIVSTVSGGIGFMIHFGDDYTLIVSLSERTISIPGDQLPGGAPILEQGCTRNDGMLELGPFAVWLAGSE